MCSTVSKVGVLGSIGSSLLDSFFMMGLMLLGGVLNAELIKRDLVVEACYARCCYIESYARSQEAGRGEVNIK